ncbi:hypothetical protein [Mesorhizobium zhangyense]|nr:hypothetical protein [Mesorhizobium zhangyense]
MKTFQTGLVAALASSCFISLAHAYTDEDSYVAVSGTAMSVTGDIQFDDFSITFENGKTLNFSGLVADTFIVDGQEVPASVYQVSHPGDPVLENDNRLCGSGAVTYIANWDDNGRSLVAVFTGDEAPSSNEEMCASYTYEQ